jgi:hypothetical protein
VAIQSHQPCVFNLGFRQEPHRAEAAVDDPPQDGDFQDYRHFKHVANSIDLSTISDFSGFYQTRPIHSRHPTAIDPTSSTSNVTNTEKLIWNYDLRFHGFNPLQGGTRHEKVSRFLLTQNRTVTGNKPAVWIRGFNTFIKDLKTLKSAVASSSNNYITGKYRDHSELRRGSQLLGHTRICAGFSKRRRASVCPSCAHNDLQPRSPFD